MGEDEPGHRSALNTFPLNFGPEGAGDRRVYRTASGEWIPDGGAWQFEGCDENGLLRSLNGRPTGVHNVSAVRQKSRAKDDTISTPDMTTWVHDSQQNRSGNENSFRETGESAWKERTRSSFSREQHFSIST